MLWLAGIFWPCPIYPVLPPDAALVMFYGAIALACQPLCNHKFTETG